MSEDLDPCDVRRREVLRLAVSGGIGLAVSGGIGIALVGARVQPVQADAALDVQIVQTASSLEVLAVELYDLVLGAGPEGMDAPAARALDRLAPATARDALRAYATATVRQHEAHRKAFQDQTTALDRNAKVQDGPNPKFHPLLRSTDLSTPEKLIDFLALVEKVATDTYLTSLTLLQDAKTKALLAGVMAVEAQHLAYLRLIGALLGGGTAQLVTVPFPAARMKDLPHTGGRVAFPDSLHRLGGPELLAEPASGAAP